MFSNKNYMNIGRLHRCVMSHVPVCEIENLLSIYDVNTSLMATDHLLLAFVSF